VHTLPSSSRSVPAGSAGPGEFAPYVSGPDRCAMERRLAHGSPLRLDSLPVPLPWQGSCPARSPGPGRSGPLPSVRSASKIDGRRQLHFRCCLALKVSQRLGCTHLQPTVVEPAADSRVRVRAVEQVEVSHPVTDPALLVRQTEVCRAASRLQPVHWMGHFRPAPTARTRTRESAAGSTTVGLQVSAAETLADL